jgi:hypothetical protein
MITFSTPPTEANQLSGIVNVLNILPDNTAKQISPKDVRDAVYTLWENTILKPTSASNSSKYIGIDQYQLTNSQDDSNIYPKMYFGKKQTGGQFIMSDQLLGTDTDFFFYNMKDNTTVGGNYHTTIAILAGTGSFLYNGAISAPIIKSTVVSDPGGSYINLDITNKSIIYVNGTESGGDINISSDRGFVSINSFIFPKVSDITSANNDYVLKYKWIAGNAYGVWESAFSQSITEINYPQGPVTITGNPIVLNGYRFTDSTVVATAIGGIQAGETFTDVDVLDMLRKIIYTYVPPRVSTFFSYNNTPLTLIESGDIVKTFGVNATVRFNYSLTINSTYSLASAVTIDSTPSGGTIGPLPPSGTSIGTYTGNVKPNQDIVLNIGEYYRIISYTFSATDTYPTTSTSNSKLTIVLPYFYGTSADFATTSNDNESDPYNINNILGTSPSAPSGKLNAILVKPIIGSPTSSDNQSVYITTQGLNINNQGYIYFGYPAGFPLLKEIKDNNGEIGNTVTSAFTTYSISITSPNSYWNDTPYIFYISNQTSVPISQYPYKFIFATQS